MKIIKNPLAVNGDVELLSANKLARLAVDKPMRLIAITLLTEHLYLSFDEPLSSKLLVGMKSLLYFKCMYYPTMPAPQPNLRKIPK